MNTDLDKLTSWIVMTVEDKKGEDLVILDLSPLDVFSERFVIATAQSRLHLKAIAEAVRDNLKKHTDEPLYIEGFDSTGWILFECGGVVLHLFTGETREYYSLERLWGDAPRLEAERFLTLSSE